MLDFSSLASTDPEIYQTIRLEYERQQSKLILIASENTASPAVLVAGACLMTNKYAEGYPGQRYYGGCEFVDQAENLAIHRACELYGAEYANVQPHAGSQANMAAFFATIKPGDTILGMNLSHGGHLTHGSPVNFSGRLYKIVSYGVDRETETINLDEVRRLAHKHRPNIIVAGASAYPRIIDFKTFADIAAEVDAYLMVDMAHIAGLVAAGVHPSPVPVADIVTSTTHKTLRGPRGGLILAKAEYGPRIDKAVFPGTQGGPLMQIIAAKAVAFKEAMSPDFVEYQKNTIKNAARLAEGLSAAGFRLVSGGTDNHLFLIDLGPKGLTGLEAEQALDRAGITANKNVIPFDPQPPKITSGLRMGSPILTSRGMMEPEMDQVVEFIVEVLANTDNESVINRVRDQVRDLCRKFPVYNGMNAT